MGKRSKGQRRKDKKKNRRGQAKPQDRGVGPDPARRALAQAQELQAKLRASREDLDPSLVRSAATLAAELRRGGRLAEALALAATCQRRTAASSAEEALAALALGQIEQAREAAAAHDSTRKILAPMIAAASTTRPPNAPRGAGPLLKAQYAAGRSLCRLRDGELDRADSALGPSRADLPRVNAGGLVEGIRLLREGPSPRRWQGLLQSWLGRDSDARGLWLRALAARWPIEALDLLDRAPGLPAPVREAMTVEVGRALDRRAAKPAAWLRLATSAGPAPFAEGAQADGWLYTGFARAEDDPAAARRAFEQAARLGADPGEVARGRLLLTPREPPPRAALELAELLCRQPGGHPLAAWWAIRASEASARNDTTAVEGLDVAERVLGEAPRPLPELEQEVRRLRVLLLALRDPSANLAALERHLVEHPEDEEAWATRLTLTSSPAEAADVARRLHAASGDPRLAQIVSMLDRAVARIEGQPPPEGAEGSPGACAARVQAALRRGDGWAHAWDALGGERAALDPEGRAALDAGALGLIGVHTELEDVPPFLRQLSRAPDAADAWPAVIVVLAELEPYWSGALRGALADALTSVAPARLVELVELAAGVDVPFARNLLMLLNPRIPGRELKRLTRAVSAPPTSWARRADDLFDTVHDRLHPELCITDLLDLGDDEDDDDEDDPLSRLVELLDEPAAWAPDPEALITELLTARLKKPGLAKQIAKVLTQDPTPQTERRMRVLLAQARMSIDELFALIPETL